MRRAVLGVVAVLALAACGGGGGGGDSDLPAGQHDLGDGVSVAVLDVTDPVPPDRAYEAKYGIDADADAGNRWVAVELEYFNRTDHPVELKLEYGASLRTSANNEIDPITELPTEKLPTLPKDVPPESSSRGWRAFEVPNDVKPSKLVLYGKIGDDPVVVDVG